MSPSPVEARGRRRPAGRGAPATPPATPQWKLLGRAARAMQRVAPAGTSRARLYRGGLAWLRARGPWDAWLALARRVGAGEDAYARWLVNHEPATGELLHQRRGAAGREGTPSISLVTVVGTATGGSLAGGDDRRVAGRLAAALAATVEAVGRQSLPAARHVLVLRDRPASDVEDVLAGAERSGATVVRPATDLGPGPARNAGLAASGGDFVAVVEPGDVLQPYALHELAALIRSSAPDVVYTDHDEYREPGRRERPFFKPDWNPELLLSSNYLARPLLVRRRLLAEIGGYDVRPGVDPDYDLALRATERARRIAHLPLPAVSLPRLPSRPSGSPSDTGDWHAAREDPPARAEAERMALDEAIRRRGWAASAEHARGLPFAYRARFAIGGAPLVSILIPTRYRGRLLERCLASIEARTTYRRYEVLILDNSPSESRPPRRADPSPGRAGPDVAPHRVLRLPEGFNFAALNNRGAREARGQLLLFLNDDVEVESGEWLSAMIEHAQRPQVGAVGARLLFPGGGVQHAGVVFGLSGVACHAFPNLPRGEAGYGMFSRVVRNYSAVTGACLMMRKDLFERLGGFDEGLQVAYNDLDLCLRANAAGFRTVYTPYAELTHHQGASRGSFHPAGDEARMRERWKDLLEAGDPCYSPNLSLHGWGFSIDPRRGYRPVGLQGDSWEAAPAGALGAVVG